MISYLLCPQFSTSDSVIHLTTNIATHRVIVRKRGSGVKIAGGGRIACMYKSPLLCNKSFKNLDSELRAKKVEESNAQTP